MITNLYCELYSRRIKNIINENGINHDMPFIDRWNRGKVKYHNSMHKQIQVETRKKYHEFQTELDQF